MSNPFDKVPSTADTTEAVDKKTVSTLASLADRLDKAIARTQAIVRNEEELAGSVFEILLDDDGSLKDFCNTAEIRGMVDDAGKHHRIVAARLGEIINSIPTTIKANLSDEDRKSLDTNFQSRKDVFRLYLPALSVVGLIIRIVLTGSIMLSNSAADTKREYEQRISQLDAWYEENADAIAFGQFYRENYPKQYHQWHNGQWQQDIAYRDSLRRAHSLDRLKRLYNSE